jgi:peptidase E
VERQNIEMTAAKKPVFLLAGGRGQNRNTPDPLLQAVFKECGVSSPKVAYVGAANEDSSRFFGFITTSFKEAGAGEISQALTVPKKADLKKAKGILESADIIFISGGDVEAGMDVLREKDMLNFLTGLYSQGKLFFGQSAGSIMLAREWIRWRDPDDDATAEIFPCLDIAPVICDTHAEGDDWEELKALLALEKNGVNGYGLPSGNGIKVFPDGRVEALGSAIPQFLRLDGKVKKAADILPVKPV